ncbi:hypothetical protein F8388_009423 [Cannabis sativa]|uniref:Fe2OG dioxygenase domain-containing protein n=2 Tax=Cannabis sativa TaxID=3483 RepID=A0AB40EBC0_CANSA|nr:hypothetical protein F8388_009423 [Cannabis sativa]KAF4387164.1 hypothetical protein G4B88_024736 [Cannabis sativa]
MAMEKLVSSWSNEKITLPESYIIPPETRPGDQSFPVTSSIPVIDLHENINQHDTIVHNIIKASQDYGIFQVINHGVCEELMDETMKVMKELHEMSPIDKARECCKDPLKRCRLYTSSNNFSNEKIHYWRDAFLHPCHPLEEHIQFWPQNPIQYREIVGKFSVEVRKLGLKILEVLSEGLGLKSGYFSGELIESPILLSNHYPACPDPSLTLGLPKHCDPSLITILLQGNVLGLQLPNHHGNWVYVEPISHAFVINIGYILQVISNGKLKGAEHRVINSRVDRTTISLFINPSNDTIIKPETTLIHGSNPPLPLYKPFCYEDFRTHHLSNTADHHANKLAQFMDKLK